MKKRFFLYIISFLFLSTAYSQVNIERTINNTFFTIDDMSIEHLRAAEKDDSSLEDYYYQQRIWREEKEIKSKLDSRKIKSEVVSGSWNLYNDDTQKFFSNKSGIYIGQTISFLDVNGFCRYKHQASTSYLYEVDSNMYVIFPTMDAGIIRLLVFDNEKLYIYNLDQNTWYLDDIHLDGSYYKLNKK